MAQMDPLVIAMLSGKHNNATIPTMAATTNLAMTKSKKTILA